MASRDEGTLPAARADAATHGPLAMPSVAVTPRDPARVTLIVMFVTGMVLSTFWILRPFLPAVVWAATIVVATWPLLIRLQRVLGGRRGLAATAMTLLLLLALIVPFALALMTIASHSADLVAWLQTAAMLKVPAPPDWVDGLPVVGHQVASRWRDLAAMSRDEMAARLSPYTRQIVGWAVGTVGSIGLLLVQLLLVVVSAAVLYASGDAAAGAVRRLARRVAGPSGDGYVRLAGQAIRGVALGVVVTALVQTGLAGVGLAVAGVPFAMVLTAVVFVLCIAQIGPALPLFGAVAWVYWSGDSTWGTVLLIWSIFVSAIDNVLRPLLIRKSADLPLALVFLGVIGGLLGFGVIGIFLGPVVLAVSYTLLSDWVAAGDPLDPPVGASAVNRPTEVTA